MQQKIGVSIFITAMITLLLLFLVFPSNVINADDSSQDFINRASSIYQNSKLIISQWDVEYSFQSLEDLKAEIGNGLAASGNYSDTVSAATLKTEELPYFGHSGLGCAF